ncbi:hypothetical protein AQS8620_00966 [Aquimixticola soesokkakensis]|uniref:DUF5333 domain-containing protein n=1 Tax=Aquimixticola soesokkakensis TaxID=1519096 RepID=A0A1Y5S1Y3_9RHOB|nr:DUF5333 domain-containing protein [Aquimixticola soesokkakensis]SLN30612.1 hypothetical protein AQS8620_00966 [Aquimixticola soesokkakensis]
MNIFPHILSATALLGLMTTAVQAVELPPLRDQARIDNSMLQVAIAYEVSEKCDSIDARKLKGLNYLWTLRGVASDLGYSDAQIKAYVESKAEKARIRKLGEAYVASKGLDPKVSADLCTLGTQEIASQSLIGSLLRAK